MRINNIKRVAWLALIVGVALAQESGGTIEDSTNSYRYREQYWYKEHIKNQGEMVKIITGEAIMNKGDTIQIRNMKAVENPAVQSEMTIEKTITKDGNNTVNIEKTVITPKDTIVIQKEVGSAKRDTVRTRERQRVRNIDSGCDGTSDTLRIREKERLRLRDGLSSEIGGTGIGTGTGPTQRRGRRIKQK